MTTVKDILTWVQTLAPVYMKESWDNVGLLCGDPQKPVTRVLVALDPFEHVCREAVRVGAQLVLTHHPLIFQAPRSVTTETSVGRSIILLCANGISAVNAHTNLDCTPGGVNDVLAAALDLENVSVIRPGGTDEAGKAWGLLRMGECDASLPEFLERVKTRLHASGLRYVRGCDRVRKVAVGGGSCGGGLMEAYDAGCDTFVTADVKYNQFWDAKELGMNLIDAGHFATENPVVPVLAEKLAAAFPELVVLISKDHGDCLAHY